MNILIVKPKDLDRMTQKMRNDHLKKVQCFIIKEIQIKT